MATFDIVNDSWHQIITKFNKAVKKIATLGYRIKWIFFATSHSKSPCDRICGSVKCHVGKRSLQRPMMSQILDYQAMLNVYKEEMSENKFSGIGKETMGGVHISLVERFSRGNTAPVSQSSYHFITLSSSELHTSYRVKTSLMLMLMILIFPQLSNCVISDQWHVWHAFITLFGGWVW